VDFSQVTGSFYPFAAGSKEGKCGVWPSAAENQPEDGFAIWTVFILLLIDGCIDLSSLLYGALRAQATWVLRI
jgi:hypothetical protein